MSHALRAALLMLVWLTVPAAAAPEPPAAPKPLYALSGHTAEIYTVAFGPDGKRVASASNQDVRVWDVTTGKEVFTYLTKGTNVFGLAFSPDGKTLAVSVSKQVRLLDAGTGQQRQIITHPTHFLFRMTFSPDGKHLLTTAGSTGNTGDVRIWEVATGKEVLKFAGHKEAPLSAAYSGDGRLVASGSGGTMKVMPGEVKVWEADTGREVQTLRGHADNVYGVSFSPDGKYVASCGGVRGQAKAGTVKLWEVASGKEVFALEGHTGPVFTVAYSPDGRRLATASGDRSVRVWEAATGKEVLNLPAHDGVVYSVAFSPDGKRLATAGQDRQVKVWELNLPAAGEGAPLTAKQLDVLWADLSGADAAKAYRGVWSLAAVPKQALPYLKERVRPAAPLTAEQEKQLAQWLRDLDDDEFTVREQATKLLTGLGEGALPALRRALKDDPPPEVRRRVEEVLEALTGAATPDRLGTLRAVDVLESIGTPEAREVLRKLASGLPEARVTQEAQRSLDRLTRRADGH